MEVVISPFYRARNPGIMYLYVLLRNVNELAWCGVLQNYAANSYSLIQSLVVSTSVAMLS